MVRLTWKINVLVLYYYNYDIVEIFAICCHKFGKNFYYAFFLSCVKNCICSTFIALMKNFKNFSSNTKVYAGSWAW